MCMYVYIQCVVQKARSKIGEETGASAHSDSYLPQHSKAKTCEFPGYGTNGKITYDWYGYDSVFMHE